MDSEKAGPMLGTDSGLIPSKLYDDYLWSNPRAA